MYAHSTVYTAQCWAAAVIASLAARLAAIRIPIRGQRDSCDHHGTSHEMAAHMAEASLPSSSNVKQLRHHLHAEVC